MAGIIIYLNEHYAITLPFTNYKERVKPFILLHGLLSDGEDLFPLAQELHEKTGQPVWILDLPGLGRSP